MKVLLSSYVCSPGGSEPGVGWHAAFAMARRHEVWVITRSRYALTAPLPPEVEGRLHFVYVDLPLWTPTWQNKLRGIQLHYYLWQFVAYIAARRLHRKVGFDVAQHLTFVKYWGPSFLALLPIPFIWGPVGGGDCTPPGFRSDFSLRGRLYESIRHAALWIGERDPFVRFTARRSAIALAATEQTAERVRWLRAPDVRLQSAIGLSSQEIEQLGSLGHEDGPVIRFISLGRLLHLKGYHLGLKAFARSRLAGAEYWIVGDGPERGRLEALAGDLGIADRVRFWGKLPRAEALQKFAQCHVLVHPSLHDSGGFVCLESMAAGRPVICLDLAGPAVHVTAESGIKVPALDPEQTVADLAAAMTRLAADGDLRRRMGRSGQQRVASDFDWDRKAQQYQGLYLEAIGVADRAPEQRGRIAKGHQS